MYYIICIVHLKFKIYRIKTIVKRDVFFFEGLVEHRHYCT